MKKLLLLVLLFTTINSYSQTIFKVHTTALGEHNGYKWQFSNRSSVYMTIVFYNDKVVVDDNAKSQYIFLEEPDISYSDNVKVYKWKVLDEKGRRCTILYRQEEGVIFIIYGKTSFVYEVK